MIVQLEAYNYRCLRAVRQPLGRFQVLIGRNATGKSTFLDVLGFLQDALLGELDLAVYGTDLEVDWFVPRTQKDFNDLLHRGQGQSFTLAVVVQIPSRLRDHADLRACDRCRYQIRVGYDERDVLRVLDERLWLISEKARSDVEETGQRSLFSELDLEALQNPLFPRRDPDGWKRVLAGSAGDAHFWSETTGWHFPLRLPSNKPALANLPEDEEKFPVAVWLKRWFLEGVRRLQLNPRALREPCPARASEELDLNGSNLPKVVQRLKESDPRRFEGWLGHVQQELGEVEDIEVRLRPEDNARYLRLRGRDGYAVPQWGVSEGSLRFLALTLLTYLSEEEGTVWLIEEPENGIHPQALESVLQALTTLYDSQVLIATHSALMLEFDELVRPEHLLCFSLQEGQTVIRSGVEILAPLDREGSPLTLGDLMAWGVLSR